MTADELARTAPRIITALVLMVFGVARIVRAHRRERICWPLPWEAVAGIFLVMLSIPMWTVALLVQTEWTAQAEHQIVYLPLWLACIVSVWTLKRWWHDL